MTTANRKTTTTTGGDSVLFKVKLFIMVFLVVLDIGLNSSVEHEVFTTCDEEFGDGTILAIILGLQLVLQIGIFASLFLMMFETYPFRVGLMGMLTPQYLAVYVMNIVYLLLTAFVYGYRVTSMVRSNCMEIWEVWDLRGYLPLSIIHKLAATVYYVTNIRAALLLADPMFYCKQAWVGLYFDRGGGGDTALTSADGVNRSRDGEGQGHQMAPKVGDARVFSTERDSGNAFAGEERGGFGSQGEDDERRPQEQQPLLI